jgi:hypothetical protein
MADQPKPEDATATAPNATSPTFSRSPIPTLFADGIANVARGAGTIRTYLVRFDPSLEGPADARQVVVAQLIMSLPGFASMALLFEAQLKDMIEKKEMPPELLDQLRKSIPGGADAS